MIWSWTQAGPLERLGVGTGHSKKDFTMSLNLNAASKNVLGALSSAPTKNQAAKAMFTSLQNGDLAGALKAYRNFTGGQSSNSALLNANSVFGQLGAALQKGDLATAQNLAASMHGASGMPVASSAGSSSASSNSSGGQSGVSVSSGASSSQSGRSNSGKSSMSLTPAGLLSSLNTAHSTSLLNAINAQDTADAGGKSDNLYALLGVGANINTLA